MRILNVFAILVGLMVILFGCDYVDELVDEVSSWNQYGGSKDEDVDFGPRDPDFPGFDCSDACFYAIENCTKPEIYNSYADCVLDCDRALDIDENIPSDFSYKTCIMECIMDCKNYRFCVDKCLPELDD